MTVDFTLVIMRILLEMPCDPMPLSRKPCNANRVRDTTEWLSVEGL